MSYFTDTVDWHRKFGVPVADRPTPLSPDRLALRLDLMAEERRELDEALGAGDLAGAAKEAVDEIVTVLGTMAEAGIPFEAVWAEVMASLHSKAEPDGTVHKRADGKILKGSRFREADIAAVLAGAAGGHILRVAVARDSMTFAVECHEPADADCRTVAGGCLVSEQCAYYDRAWPEYYGRMEPLALYDGMPISVSWSTGDECWEWQSAVATPQAVTE